MDRVNKEELVTSYSRLFDSYKAVFLIRNLGLSVVDSRSIGSHLKKIDSRFMVTKNSLARIALKDTKFLGVRGYFTGPIAVAYSDDPVSASQILVKFCRHNNGKADIVGGAILDKSLDKKEIIALSEMPTQDEIRAKIINLANAVSTKIVRTLGEPGVRLVRVIKAYTEKQ
jgi:large subunit ribosomal protein L10